MLSCQTAAPCTVSFDPNQDEGTISPPVFVPSRLGVDADQLKRELEDFVRKQRESGGGKPPR